MRLRNSAAPVSPFATEAAPSLIDSSGSVTVTIYDS